jgi:hypothetical protein
MLYSLLTRVKLNLRSVERDARISTTTRHSLASLFGSTMDASSLSDLLTLVEIGHIRFGSAGNGRIRSRAGPAPH